MRITTKGQVAIPAHLRETAGLLPNTDVDFVLEGKTVKIVRKVAAGTKPSRGARLTAHLKERGDVAMSTDEIMALTRSD